MFMVMLLFSTGVHFETSWNVRIGRRMHGKTSFARYGFRQARRWMNRLLNLLTECMQMILPSTSCQFSVRWQYAEQRGCGLLGLLVSGTLKPKQRFRREGLYKGFCNGFTRVLHGLYKVFYIASTTQDPPSPITIGLIPTVPDLRCKVVECLLKRSRTLKPQLP